MGGAAPTTSDEPIVGPHGFDDRLPRALRRLNRWWVVALLFGAPTGIIGLTPTPVSLNPLSVVLPLVVAGAVWGVRSLAPERLRTAFTGLAVLAVLGAAASYGAFRLIEHSGSGNWNIGSPLAFAGLGSYAVVASRWLDFEGASGASSLWRRTALATAVAHGAVALAFLFEAVGLSAVGAVLGVVGALAAFGSLVWASMAAEQTRRARSEQRTATPSFSARVAGRRAP